MKAKINIFIISLLLISSTIGNAQHCGTDEYYHQQLLKDPGLKARRDSLEAFTKSFTLQRSKVITNGDFEDWQDDELKGWKTNSCSQCVPWKNTYIVIQDSTIVYHGKYSAKLLPGAYAENEFPLCVHPSGLNAYVRCEPGIMTAVSITVELLKKGSVVDSGSWRTETPTNRWTEITIPISKTSTVIDSALIRINAEGIVWVDDLFFK